MAVLKIVRRHSLPQTLPEAFSTSTNPVVALDRSVVLKIFVPLYRRQFLSERASLFQRRGRVDVAIPEIMAEGEQGQGYLAMTRIDGVLGSDAWPLVPEEQKETFSSRSAKPSLRIKPRRPVGSSR